MINIIVETDVQIGPLAGDEPSHARERRWPADFEININSRRPRDACRSDLKCRGRHYGWWMAMSKHVKGHRQTTHPDLLVDTAAYQGVSEEFEVVQELVTKKLRGDQSLQNQLTCEQPIRSAIESLFEKYQRLEIVIAGWIDQAVLEFHSSLQGDRRCLPKMLDQLDAYRPDQNGDMCFYLADLDYNEVLATMISFEDVAFSTKSYRRSCSADGGG